MKKSLITSGCSHLRPYFVYASRGSSGKSVHFYRLAGACAAQKCHKSQNLMFWLICFGCEIRKLICNFLQYGDFHL